MPILKEEVKAKWKFSKGGGESNLLVRNFKPRDKILQTVHIIVSRHLCLGMLLI